MYLFTMLYIMNGVMTMAVVDSIPGMQACVQVGQHLLQQAGVQGWPVTAAVCSPQREV